MESGRIYLMGDAHTVTAFRVGGIEGVITDKEGSESILTDISGRDDAAIILITRDLSEPITEMITEINLNRVSPVIVEIPGIDDQRGFGKSLLGYITEALGVSI